MTMDFGPIEDLKLRQSPKAQEEARIQLGIMLQDLDREVEDAKQALLDKMNEMLAVEAQQAKPSKKLEELNVEKARLSERLRELQERFVRASAEAASF